MYNAIASNKRNTVIIMLAFIGLISAIGWIFSIYLNDQSVFYTTLFIATVYALIQYYFASSLALSMNGAKPIEKKDNPRLYRIVENLAITIGQPTPKIYIIEDSAPNAFATGRDPQHAVVAASTGLLDIMDDNELEAVMAHEMGHVKNYDIRLSMITFGLVSAVSFLSDIALRIAISKDGDNENVHPIVYVFGFILILLSPVVALAIQMAVSRQREYLADATSAMITRNPGSMVSALQKLKSNARPMKHQNAASAHLFIYNPLKAGFINGLFSTHPKIEDRIARLNENSTKF